ncbi:MAG: molybdenum cofactor biosynthesis protein MoaE [Dehalococcoidia bacterium]
MIVVTEKAIDPREMAAVLGKGANGAVVTFMGVIRGLSGGKRVLHLEYEAHEEMAREKLEEVAQEIQVRWQLEDFSVIHRVGRIQPGEVAVAIAVAAPHRQEAFEACRYAIDRIKEIVPVWKKEVYEDGGSWVGAHP